jgi:hypothetical protein
MKTTPVLLAGMVALGLLSATASAAPTPLGHYTASGIVTLTQGSRHMTHTFRNKDLYVTSRTAAVYDDTIRVNVSKPISLTAATQTVSGRAAFIAPDNQFKYIAGNLSGPITATITRTTVRGVTHYTITSTGSGTFPTGSLAGTKWTIRITARK